MVKHTYAHRPTNLIWLYTYCSRFDDFLISILLSFLADLHTSTVTKCYFSPGDDRLFTTSMDHLCRVWDLKTCNNTITLRFDTEFCLNLAIRNCVTDLSSVAIIQKHIQEINTCWILNICIYTYFIHHKWYIEIKYKCKYNDASNFSDVLSQTNRKASYSLPKY